MSKKELIPFIPYIAGLITYLFLLLLKKQGKLKRFDKYLWSPLVVGFGGVCLGLIIMQIFIAENFNFFFQVFATNFRNFLYGLLMFSQLLWLSVIFQIISIKYDKVIFLLLARIFVFISILPAILFYILMYGVE